MKIIYLSLSNPENSINNVYISGLRENGIEVKVFCPLNKNFLGHIKTLSFLIKEKKTADFVIVGWDSPTLVILTRFFSRKKIVYNAVLSIYEKMVISRDLVGKFSIKALYYWFLDFVAVHFANLVMVETNHQADYFKKIFRIDEKKLFRAWVGVNEKNFYFDPNIKKFETFTVLFRGAFMPESGVEFAVQASKILENEKINFIIVGGGLYQKKIDKLIKEQKPSNLKLITDYLSYDELRKIMQKCHLSLGQLSDHIRLTRTIPHKAYESLAMKLPYLTASNSGIFELLTPNKTCLACSPADVKSLADKILWVKNNYSLAEKIAQNGYWLHQNKLKSDVLAYDLISKIKQIS